MRLIRNCYHVCKLLRFLTHWPDGSWSKLTVGMSRPPRDGFRLRDSATEEVIGSEPAMPLEPAANFAHPDVATLHAFVAGKLQPPELDGARSIFKVVKRVLPHSTHSHFEMTGWESCYMNS